MARIEIDLPEKFIFDTEISVRISDINYGGHLGNDTVLSLAHEARVRFFKKIGHKEIDNEEKGIIITDAAIVYKAEGFHGDLLRISIATDDHTRVGFDMLYKIVRVHDQKEIARVKTGIVFFDYQTKKVIKMPDGFLEKVKS